LLLLRSTSCIKHVIASPPRDIWPTQNVTDVSNSILQGVNRAREPGWLARNSAMAMHARRNWTREARKNGGRSALPGCNGSARQPTNETKDSRFRTMDRFDCAMPYLGGREGIDSIAPQQSTAFADAGRAAQAAQQTQIFFFLRVQASSLGSGTDLWVDSTRPLSRKGFAPIGFDSCAPLCPSLRISGIVSTPGRARKKPAFFCVLFAA